MKITHNCYICGEEFRAPKKTKFKACNLHRNSHRQGVYRMKRKQTMVELNDKFNTFRVVYTTGFFKYKLEPVPFKHGSSVKALYDSQQMIAYLEEMRLLIEKDLQIIKDEIQEHS